MKSPNQWAPEIKVQKIINKTDKLKRRLLLLLRTKTRNINGVKYPNPPPRDKKVFLIARAKPSKVTKDAY
jgi:hypothetical protein